MIIKKTGKYDRNRKEFIVLEYCCERMGREMNQYPYWQIYNNDEMDCGDYEGGVGGRYCCYCGKEIIIKS